MWLTGRLAPDHKTIADFRHDNARGIRQACSQFVAICRKLKLLAEGVIVRPVANYGLPAHLRVTVGTREQNDRFLGALARALGRA